jgi:hypothetical protein
MRLTRIGELETTLAATSTNASCEETTRRNIPEDGIFHSRRHGNLKSYIALTDWAQWRKRNVFPVRYELGFYIAEDGIFHSYRKKTSDPT